MIGAKNVAIMLLLFLATACSGLQVQRDLKHAGVTQSYKTLLATAAEFDPEKQCVLEGKAKTWTPLDFAEATPITKLPSGLNASGLCLRVPSGSQAMEVMSDARGGLTYHELIMVSPSLQFLDADYQLIKDVPDPRLSPADTLNGLGLRGVVVLTTDLAKARYVVVYVHPGSLEGSVIVQTGVAAIPVPFGPYGKVKIRFQ
jgi:hypothetical protein